MAQIEVKLKVFYGYDCMGQGYSHEKTQKIDINEQEFEALKKLGAKKVSCKSVVKAIKNGETVLKPLHEKLEDMFYYMDEEYWLYKAENKFLHESLEEHIEQDIKDGLYSPIPLIKESFDCHCTFYADNEDEDCFNYEDFENEEDLEDYLEDYDNDEDFEDEEDIEDDDNNEDDDYDNDDDCEGKKEYDLDDYYNWILEHRDDHAFVAERIGLNLEACREDKVNYTITL